MAAGLSREQLGVSDAMIAAFGELVFRLSNNVQHRRGDPVRARDFDAIDSRRGELGMSDGQIAVHTGLSEAQVCWIRNHMEAKSARTGNFHRLLELGGGRRFRDERFTPHENRHCYSRAALELRESLRTDPGLATSYVEQGWWSNHTLSGWLQRWARTTPQRDALITPDRRLSYAALLDQVERLAGSLRALGIERGDVVMVQLPNTPEYVIVYLAVARLGAVLSTLYMPHRSAEIQNLLEHSRATALVCPDRIGEFSTPDTVRALQRDDKLADLRHIIVAGSAGEGCVALADLLAAPAAGSLPDSPVAADPLMLLYTSGTTAGPKGVPHNSHSVLSNAAAGVGEHGIHPGDVVLSAPPFGHLYGLYSLHLALCAGAGIALLPAFTPSALASTIAVCRPTVLFAAPAQLIACLGAGLFEQHDVSSLRLTVLSGNAVPGDVVRRMNALMAGGVTSQLWGMTETQAGTYTRPDDDPALAARSAGRPSPGTELRVVDERGEPLEAGREGELQVRGPLLFPGYLRNEAANRAAFTSNHWFRSGDLAMLDDDGNVTITGRLKDVINRGGVKYNPRDVEELVDAHPAVQQSAIVPMVDPVLGERACCFVVLGTEAELTLESLCSYLLDHGIAKLKLPEKLRVVAEMPMTPTRKVIKGRLPVDED